MRWITGRTARAAPAAAPGPAACVNVAVEETGREAAAQGTPCLETARFGLDWECPCGHGEPGSLLCPGHVADLRLKGASCGRCSTAGHRCPVIVIASWPL